MSLVVRRQIPFGRPWLSSRERDAVMAVLDGPILTHGPQGKAFEAEFAAFMGADAHAVSVSSCMAALHLACLHLGLGAGDDAVVPAQTHVATAHAVEWTGARPVFADCDPRTGNLTPATIEAVLTPRTKAILVVHYAGIPCDMPAIMSLAARRGLRVIEDCAIALGARYEGRHVGLFGDAGCFSFYPVKHITTGEGGMFVSKDAATAAAVARLRAFGVDRTHDERSVPGMYDVPLLGLNYRMSEMQAALGRVQMQRVDENLALRQAHFERLSAHLARTPGLHVIDSTDTAARNSHYCLTVVLGGALARRRSDLVSRLGAAGVGTSVYYPQPVPRMTYYRRKYGYEAAQFPHAVEISDASVALPVGPHLTADDVDYVGTAVNEAVMELHA